MIVGLIKLNPKKINGCFSLEKCNFLIIIDLLLILQMIPGLREWFSQKDEHRTVPRIPMMVDVVSDSVSSKTSHKQQGFIRASSSVDRMQSYSRTSAVLDEESDEDEEYLVPETAQEVLSDFFTWHFSSLYWSWFGLIWTYFCLQKLIKFGVEVKKTGWQQFYQLWLFLSCHDKLILPN